MKNYWMAVSAAAMFVCFSCNTGNGKGATTGQTEEKTVIKAPDFNADSAYQYVKAQVDFGPRVPNTAEHVACGNYLAKKLEEYGAKEIGGAHV